VAVYDRWHRDPQPGDEPCRCGRGRHRLYPGDGHEKGDRWQVRWRDPDTGRQKSRNFALRDPATGELPDRNRHASAYDKEIQGSIVRQDYTDPAAGDVRLRDYAEERRRARTHGQSAAAGLESRLRCHVYEGEEGSARTPKGGVSIGQHKMAMLARRPSLIAAWAASIPLADGSRRKVLDAVSAVFEAAIADGVVRSNPLKSGLVDRPGRGGGSARPYSAAEISGIAARLPGRFGIVPYLGVGTGMREMEMCGLGADDVARGARPRIRVVRQVQLVGGELRFAPVKNRKPHDVPVPRDLVERLDAHMRAYPPLTVTLPWHEPGGTLHGEPVTVRLVLSRRTGAAVTKSAMESAWREAAGRMLAPQLPQRKRSKMAKGYGIHRTRHTAASAWLRAGIDVVRAAAWLGDTVQMVTTTYAHLMPDDHDGDEAGRSATSAFLGACARSVHDEGEKTAPGLMRAV
jgi:integrase